LGNGEKEEQKGGDAVRPHTTCSCLRAQRWLRMRAPTQSYAGRGRSVQECGMKSGWKGGKISAPGAVTIKAVPLRDQRHRLQPQKRRKTMAAHDTRSGPPWQGGETSIRQHPLHQPAPGAAEA